MKLRGFYFRETGLARLISPTRSSEDGVWVPQDRTTHFRKLPCSDANALPREVEFEVEGWLAKKPEFAGFRPVEAAPKEDYRKKELSNKWDFHIKHCDQCAASTTNYCPIGQHILDQIAAL